MLAHSARDVFGHADVVSATRIPDDVNAVGGWWEHLETKKAPDLSEASEVAGVGFEPTTFRL